MNISLLLRSFFIGKQVPPFRVKKKEWNEILYGKSQDTNNWHATEN
jgi:hypothetical protein